MNFPKPELPEGYEFITDENYILKRHDLYWWIYTDGKLYRDTIHVMAGRALGVMQVKYNTPYFAKFTGRLNPYFKDRANEFPKGF